MSFQEVESPLGNVFVEAAESRSVPQQTTHERWKTLKRQDPEFSKYLTGAFSSEFRAIPVRSLNVNTAQEEITFEILPVSEMKAPAFAAVAWRSVRPQTLILSMNPLLVTLAYCTYVGYAIHPWLALSSLLGVILFHLSVNLLNDYHDYVRGQDRVNPTGGSRMIQKGFVRAKSVQQAGFLLMGLAVVCGLPAIFSNLSLMAIIALITLVAGLEFSSERLGFKYRGLGEVIIFLLSGPLLSSGFSWAVTGEFHPEMILLGFVFGFITAIFYHLANLEDIMVDSQANVRTLAAWLGFDESKKLLRVLGGLSIFSLLAFSLAVDSLLAFSLGAVAQVVVLIPVSRRVKQIASPLSSDLHGIRSYALLLQALTSVALLMAFLFSF